MRFADFPHRQSLYGMFQARAYFLEYTKGVLRGLIGHGVFAHSVYFSQFIYDKGDKRRLVSLSPVRCRCQIRCVSFQYYSGNWDTLLDNFSQFLFFERNHAANAKAKAIEIQKLPCFFGFSTETMENAAPQSAFHRR